MELVLHRVRFEDTHTIGQLYVDGSLFCFVLEDVVREVEGQPVEKWKIHGETAIPQGKYRLTLSNSPRFGPDTMTIQSVPGFSGIRIHAGNTPDDTEGCPILGYKLDKNNMIAFGTTRSAVADLKERVKRAIRTLDEQVWITISNISKG